MSVYRIDPLRDPRWAAFVEAHSKATAFHTPAWLEALRRTYGYEPFALTTSAPGADLANGLVFCRVKSWLTGSRLVSLPFADHCQPLFDHPDELCAVLEWVTHEAHHTRARHIEIRPVENEGLGLIGHTQFGQETTFRLHLLDLKPGGGELLRSFDKDSVQRRLRRAEKEGLRYEEGRSPALLKRFYQLMVQTRRRHRIPPQPLAWFRNLCDAMGEKAKVHVVSKADVPVASILTLSHNGSVIYKYGCSDERLKALAGTPFLFWRVIQEAKECGAHTFDMGRSDLDNPGLINFKSNWGTVDRPLTYWRYPAPLPRRVPIWPSGKEAASYVVSHLPDGILVALGKVLYRHVG